MAKQQHCNASPCYFRKKICYLAQKYYQPQSCLATSVHNHTMPFRPADRRAVHNPTPTVYAHEPLPRVFSGRCGTTAPALTAPSRSSARPAPSSASATSCATGGTASTVRAQTCTRMTSTAGCTGQRSSPECTQEGTLECTQRGTSGGRERVRRRRRRCALLMGVTVASCILRRGRVWSHITQRKCRM